jgi:hypothetical protein
MGDWLTDRRVWYGAGLLVLAAATVGLYLLEPWPGVASLIVDGVLLFAVYVTGLIIISQFVLPVQTMGDRYQVLNYFFSYGFGGGGPIVFVRDGKLVARKEELGDQQPGVAVLDSASAIVLERSFAAAGSPLVEARGPGVVFIQGGQRVVATLDLRKQSRGLTTKALTKDGLEVTASVSITFGLSPEPKDVAPAISEPLGRNRPARIFDPERCFRAVYGSALGGDRQPVSWTELPAEVATECFRDAMAEHTLDSLFLPTVKNPNHYPFADFQKRVADAVKESGILADRGIIVFSVGVSLPKLPREVLNQRVRAWRTSWQLASTRRMAAVNSEAIKTRGHYRARAQEQIINDLKAALAENPNQSKQALALILTRSLQTAAQDPATRKQLSQEVLTTIEQLQEWVK